MSDGPVILGCLLTETEADVECFGCGDIIPGRDGRRAVGRDTLAQFWLVYRKGVARPSPVCCSCHVLYSLPTTPPDAP